MANANDRAPNVALARVITASGVSHKGLAHRINALSSGWGRQTRYTHTSVANWLSGMTPQWPGPLIIAAALGERLNRRITIADIGMAASEPIHAEATSIGLDFPRDLPTAITGAAQLWSNMHRRSFVVDATFAVAALATPLQRWLIQPVDPDVSYAGGRRVGERDIAELVETAEHARRWDSKYGGGGAGTSLVTSVLRDKAAMLLHGSYSDQVGRRLFSATAELTRVAGWAAADMNQHGLAQRHYIQALRLARAAGDVPLGGYVLTSMAIQASLTGYPDEAIDMAQAAVERAKHHTTPRVGSFFRLIEARAHARAGDRPAAEHALADAERLLGRAQSSRDPDPEWISFYSYARLAADAAEIYRDLSMPQHVMRWHARAVMPNRFMRSYGIRLTIVSSAHLQAGRLDEAIACGHDSIDVLARVSSTRSAEYLRDLLRRLEPWRAETAVQDFRQRAAQAALS